MNRDSFDTALPFADCFCTCC